MTQPDTAPTLAADPIRVRLNIGCGNFPAAGWVNVDLAETADVHPDLVADLRTITWPDHWSIERVYMGHVLEHLPFEDVVPALERLRGLLPPKTPVIAVGPDVDRAEAYGQAQVDAAKSGGDRWSGDTHKWDCREKTLAKVFLDAGYTGVVYLRPDSIPVFWPVTSRVGWQCAVAATS